MLRKSKTSIICIFWEKLSKTFVILHFRSYPDNKVGFRSVFVAKLYVYEFLSSTRIRSDPYHLAGSASGNVNPDPGSKKKIMINSHKNQPKLLYNFLKKKSLILIYVNNKTYKIQKEHRYHVFTFYKKIEKYKNWNIRTPGSGSGSASKWSGSETLKNTILNYNESYKKKLFGYIGDPGAEGDQLMEDL